MCLDYGYAEKHGQVTLRILITAGDSKLSKILCESLSTDHEVIITDRHAVSSDCEFFRSDLDDTDATNKLVKDIDVIVHSGQANLESTPTQLLDYHMRCTYNLLWAASEEGVKRFIYLSSLDLMDSYDPDFAVTERWKPIAKPNPAILCCHLGEIICREFARESKINTVILRLGDIVFGDEPNVSTKGLFIEDASIAVSKAIDTKLSGWLDIFHIQSVVPNARYLTGQPWWSADDVSPSFSLGYEPKNR